jgi:hypothetical protein
MKIFFTTFTGLDTAAVQLRILMHKDLPLKIGDRFMFHLAMLLPMFQSS